MLGNTLAQKSSYIIGSGNIRCISRLLGLPFLLLHLALALCLGFAFAFNSFDNNSKSLGPPEASSLRSSSSLLITLDCLRSNLRKVSHISMRSS